MAAVLTIAGSDPTGGAGIQMDLRTFTRFGVYGLSVVTAVTVQNTQGVIGFLAVPVDTVSQQLDKLISTIKPDATKTGMLATGEILEAVVKKTEEYRIRNLVVDPILLSKNGVRLLDETAWDLLKSKLIPLAKIVTPNLFEASVLSGVSINSLDEMREAALIIRSFGVENVLIKGGHLKGAPVDILYDGKQFIEFQSRRVKFRNVHGTGCAFSAAIAAGLANGLNGRRAVAQAKRYITEAISDSIRLDRGDRILR